MGGGDVFMGHPSFSPRVIISLTTLLVCLLVFPSIILLISYYYILVVEDTEVSHVEPDLIFSQLRHTSHQETQSRQPGLTMCGLSSFKLNLVAVPSC